MPINSSDENTNAADQQPDAYTVRDKFTYDNTTIVPDRGTITFTVDSSRPNEYAFTVSDADGNLLGDGIFTDIDFSIQSFHINQQPDVPPKSEQQPQQ